MANKTDHAQVAKGAQKRKQSLRMVIGMLDDQSAIVGMQGEDVAFIFYTKHMQPNHYTPKGSDKPVTSLQTFVCGKGGADVPIELFDENGDCTGNEIGWFKANCKINNTFLIDTIAETNDIDMNPKA